MLAVIVIAGSFFLGIQVGESRTPAIAKAIELQNKELNKPEEVDFSAFWKAWNIINSKYVPTSASSTPTSQDKVWGAIKGLAASLDDPYTVFLPPVESEIFQSDVRGNFEGVGIEIGMRDGILTVIAPLKDTPAYRAGMKAGDKIIEIDGKSTLDIDIDQAINHIRGKKGTTVVFTVVRGEDNEQMDISVVRDVINIPTIETELLPSGVFNIELYNFSAVSPNLFRDALREFVDSGSDKLILDLRGNPGGYLEAAIDMASWFLPSGKVIVREDYGSEKDPDVYRSKGYNVFNENLKMVILIDGGSASASEILAGALSQNDIAQIVGERSFGKGSVQELIDITPETSIKVTVARWLTPDGTSISEEGIMPHYEVKFTKEDAEAGNDPQLNKAVEVLLTM